MKTCEVHFQKELCCLRDRQIFPKKDDLKVPVAWEEDRKSCLVLLKEYTSPLKVLLIVQLNHTIWFLTGDLNSDFYQLPNDQPQLQWCVYCFLEARCPHQDQLFFHQLELGCNLSVLIDQTGLWIRLCDHELRVRESDIWHFWMWKECL